jgi:hypothetical protein
MSHGRSVFSQLIAYLPQRQLDAMIMRYQGNWHVRRFPVWSQLLCMIYAQLTHRDSLRDVEACLNSQGKRLYHMGIVHRVARSTLADANEVRDFRIFQELGQLLIAQALELYRDEPLGLELKEALYALDSTTIDLCLTLFPWADFRRTKAAIKVHTLLSLRGPIPAFIDFSDGRSHDVNALDIVPIPKRSIVAMDRGYTDWERLYAIHCLPAYFVIRAKDNLAFRRVASNPVDKSTGLRADQTITFTTWQARHDYPETLRRVVFFDAEQQRRLVFLTNHFGIPAKMVADIYKSRWQIELFFKWIKQHLVIKSFYGTSPNAVKTQVWIALIVYLLIAIVRKQLKLTASLHTILTILEVNLFETVPIIELITETVQRIDATENTTTSGNQLILFPE